MCNRLDARLATSPISEFCQKCLFNSRFFIFLIFPFASQIATFFLIDDIGLVQYEMDLLALSEVTGI